MKCPKCDGELRILTTGVLADYVDVDIVCDKDDSHIYFVRAREEDLIEI